MKTIIRLLFVAIFSLSGIAIYEVAAQNSTIYYEFGSSAVNSESKAELDKTLSSLDTNNFYLFEIAGHTDGVGTLDDNFQLSMKRVYGVRDYIVSNSDVNISFRMKYYGETEAVKNAQDEIADKDNRKVTIEVIKRDKPNDVFGYKPQDEQVFAFKDTVEILKATAVEGTRFEIDKTILRTIDGRRPIGDIEVNVKEFYKMEDLLFNHYTTMADGFPLESGGTIDMTITDSEGNALYVKSDETFVVEFPSDMITKQGMTPWSGKVDKTGAVVWNAETDVQYMAEKKKEEKVNNDEDVSIVWSESLKEYYKLNVPKLGMINCDRFMNQDNLTALKVSLDTIVNINIQLLFPEENALMSPNSIVNGVAHFSNIPMGSEIIIVAMGVKDEAGFYGVKKIKVEKMVEYKMTVKTATAKNLFKRVMSATQLY